MSGILAVQGGRVNLVPNTSSWLEAKVMLVIGLNTKKLNTTNFGGFTINTIQVTEIKFLLNIILRIFVIIARVLKHRR